MPHRKAAETEELAAKGRGQDFSERGGIKKYGRVLAPFSLNPGEQPLHLSPWTLLVSSAGAARFAGDATVRRGGLVLLSSLVGVDSELWTKLPPASAAQARNALRAVAAADPEKELRELAAQLSSAVDEAIGEAPPVTTPAMPVSASPLIGALNIGL